MEGEAAYYDHPGVVVTACSGDCGYLNLDCASEEERAGANFPADSPDVVAVGGTHLTESGGSWTSTAWVEGGSGCSKIFSAPLWQLKLADFAATGCAGGRSVADVSAVADPQTGVDVYDSTPEYAHAPTGWGVWGGTSVVLPDRRSRVRAGGRSPRRGLSRADPLSRTSVSPARSMTSRPARNGTCATTSCKAVVGYDGPTGVGSPLGVSAFTTPGAPAGVTAPVITGSGEVGSTLGFTHGSWSGSPTSIEYQWELCNELGAACSAIAGATGATLPVTSADTGDTFRIQETAGNSTGAGVEQSSAATAPVASGALGFTSFSPSSGITGSTVTISGTGLGQVTSVEFDGLQASFKVVSQTMIEAVVPNGAKKGKVTVSGSGGTLVSKEKFTPTLSVTSISPESGAVGKQISVKGVGFAPGVSVSFGGVAATSVKRSSAKSLKVIVPPGAVSGPVTVTNTVSPVGSVQSAASFTVN